MKLLIIRLSSFGDIVQCMSVLDDLHANHENAKIDWICRSDFQDILKLSSSINKVWSFDRKLGIVGLLKMSLLLRSEGYTHIYDAHSTIRSRIISFIVCFMSSHKIDFKRRSKDRLKRILLFKFRKNLFPKPYLGMNSYKKPILSWLHKKSSCTIQKWDFENTQEIQLPFEKYIVLAPSAAWPMKTWPVSHFKNLIDLLRTYNFIILGGPADKFCQEFEDLYPDNTKNMAGKLTLEQSCLMIKNASFVVSADTGLIHVADILGVKGASILGPTAFGRCSGSHIKTFEKDLECRPCTKDGRGNCSQDIYQKCMTHISALEIATHIKEVLG